MLYCFGKGRDVEKKNKRRADCKSQPACTHSSTVKAALAETICSRWCCLTEKANYLGNCMKKHGQVEQKKRIDSFEAECRAFLLDGCELLPFSREGKAIRLGRERIVKLDYVHNAAGRLTFLLCPSCGRRVRFLFLPKYECRTCARLNYRSQQVTRGSLEDIRGIPEKLGLDEPGIFDFDYVLSRPRGMNSARFERLNRRFIKKFSVYAAQGKKMMERLALQPRSQDLQ